MKTKDETLKALVSFIADKCKPIDLEARFDDMLDEYYSFEKVGGPFENMSPSRVLRECDPVAHRCGVNDYAEGEEWTEIGGETYETSEAEKARDEFVSNLQTEAEELEEEIADLESEDNAEIAKLKTGLHEKKAEIEAAAKAELYNL